MSPGASIIVVTYNSATTIECCLVSVLRTLRACDELVVIDNHSQDDTVSRVQRLVSVSHLPVKVLPQQENLGFSRACNLGILNSDREYVILLNPDTEVFADWVARLTAHFREYPRTGAVGAITNAGIKSQNVLTYFPDYLDYIDRASELIATLAQQFNRKSVPTRLLMGFCIALRRDLLQRLGGMDEDIFLGDDDLELSWRLRRSGYFLRVALDVFVNHEDHVSFNTLEKSKAQELVQQGTDVLFRKMQAYYHPRRVPDPRVYFGIDWWRPSILDEKSFEEVFERDLLPGGEQGITATVKSLLRARRPEEAARVLEQALDILPYSYPLWYLAGSVYLVMQDDCKAEFALKNAWCFEKRQTRARDKLYNLFKQQGRLAEAHRLFGE